MRDNSRCDVPVLMSANVTKYSSLLAAHRAASLREPAFTCTLISSFRRRSLPSGVYGRGSIAAVLSNPMILGCSLLLVIKSSRPPKIISPIAQNSNVFCTIPQNGTRIWARPAGCARVCALAAPALRPWLRPGVQTAVRNGPFRPRFGS